ncbi:MAG: cysteine desulfurase [Planctomycetes bacterium]|nr:cysteine desulfurase [Planctomycetota bacterium]
MNTPPVSLTRSPFDIQAVRGDFPTLARPLPNGATLAYLDNGATAQKPLLVIDKLREIYETCTANAHRGIHQLGDRVTVELEAAREKIRYFLNAADVAEIVFTSGATMSINLVAHAWGRKFLKPGDEILLNEMEHHANLVPWQQTARATGAKLRFIPLTADGRLDALHFDRLITKRTKLLAVTAMSNVLGTINPIRELASRAKSVGAVILVDGAQSVPHLPTDVRDPAIDFLAFSGHKLYGPTGIGVLYGRRELLEAMDPFLCGGNMINEVQLETSTWGELPAKFEAGTIPITEAIGLGAAIDYVQSIGFEAIHTQELKLLDRALRLLPQQSGVTVYGPTIEHRGSIVSFTVEKVHPHDLADLLDQKGVAVRAGHHCTMPLHDWLDVAATARASFAFYNTEAEVDTLIDAIHYARHKFRLE